MFLGDTFSEEVELLLPRKIWRIHEATSEHSLEAYNNILGLLQHA